MKLVLSWMVGFGSLALVACGGKVFVDLPTGGGETGGSGGAAGRTGGGGAGTGAGGPCSTCSEAISDAEENVLCPGPSQDLYDALNACICQGTCGMVCADLCVSPPGTMASPICINCIQDASELGCGIEFNRCSNDV